MLRYLKLLWLFARVSVQDTAAYRADFLVHVLLAFVQLGAELTAIWTIFSNTRSLAGWSATQILALLGVFRIMTGFIGMMVGPNMRLMMEDIRDGKLDYLVMKPVNAQFFASTRKLVLWRGTDVLFGIGLILFAAIRLSSSIAPGRVALFIVMVFCGIAIVYSFWLVLATMAFWFTRINNIELVFWNVFEAGRYPVEIYSPWVRWGLTYIIPLAFLTTFPAGTLLGKTAAYEVIVAIIAAALSLWLSSKFWRYGLRHYSGASA